MRRSFGTAACLLISLVAVATAIAAPPRGLVTASGAVSGLQPTTAPSSEPTTPAAAGADTFLGFDLGEERRYMIAPDNAMRDGERATWSIRLDRVETVGDRSVGVFEFDHEEMRRGVSFSGGITAGWKYFGEARINEYGFPERVQVSMYEEHTGEAPWRGEQISVLYEFDGDEYVKTVEVPDQEWTFTVPLATHDDLDTSIPSGMFLFRPDPRGIHFFMNPALLGFVIPDLVPEGWEQRVMFFRPTFPVRYPNAGYVGRERDRVAALRRYYVKRTLELEETMEMEIGGRTLNVRKIDVSGAVRPAYIDEFGRIVRIDLDPDPITRRPRHIRILFPSEY